MSTQTENNKRLAKNTFLLYGRMLVTVGISFYSTRLILANLGVENYGIYNVIGGFVSMFYMVTSTMTQAVGRFLTFELGTGDEKKLQQTFSTSVNILLLLSLIVVLLAETVGLWFVNYKLNISPNRMVAANWIYQFSVLSFIFEMISVPYSASVVSHEKMGAFALVTILKVILTLGIAFLLTVSPIDKLIFYGILILLVSVSIQLMYWIYCRKNFQECRYSLHIDRSIFKSMFGYAGWNFLTTCSSMLSSQGVNIMFNIYFGTIVNAAYGISNQIKGTVGSFTKNFMIAINPQITKSYAANNINYTKVLVYNGAKFSYILFYIVSLPLILEIDYFLKLWLKSVPQYTNYIIIISFINFLINILLNSSEVLNKATGKIKFNQLILCTIDISIIIFSCITLALFKNVILTAAIPCIINIVFFIPRILVNKHTIGISVRSFFKEVLLRVLIMSIISLFISYIPILLFKECFLRFILTVALSILSVCVNSYLFILNEQEKEKVKKYILGRLIIMK